LRTALDGEWQLAAGSLDGDRGEQVSGAPRGSAVWNRLQNVDIHVLGLVIVGMFVATWAIALVVWRLGRIEERWSAHLDYSLAAAVSR
jgi:hypothetical protein